MVNLTVPGVKIQEVSTLPPSVAPVDTAIPAFVGYTAKNGGAIKKIKSFLEFEQFFGGPEPLAVTVTLVDEVADPIKADSVTGALISIASTKPHYLLYYSVKSFYDNGGGDCYISSAGIYAENAPFVIDNEELENALALVGKEDQPTLLVIPDAINLSDQLYGSVYQKALQQCGTLKDRFTILDAYPSGEKEVARFTLEAYDEDSHGDFAIFSNQAGVTFAFRLIIDTDPITSAIFDAVHATRKVNVLIEVGDDADAIATKVLAAIVGLGTWTDSGMEITRVDDKLTLTQKNFGATDNAKVHNLAGDPSPSGSITLELVTDGVNINDITNIRNVLGTNYLKYGAAYYPRLKTIYTPSTIDAKITVSTAAIFVDSTLEALIKNNPTIAGNTIVGNPLLASQIRAAVNAQLSNYPVVVGPGGAIAGVYARTDFDIGVWKAPANTSISAISGTTLQIGDDLQSLLNVDATSGKSINAIRFFSGKGNLVWGARTLAGNDNEWRYINVRRLMIFIEESCQKASSQFVFEPNTAQTWQRIKGMVDNFLTNLWRQGALAGAKPEDAFFVRIGIGTTMTAQDILDGVMNVEIGVAPSRPAEFIVLKFSHKLQVS
jgi:uncharacterized protein